MTSSFFKRIVPHALQAAAVSFFTFAVSGCGGGSGSGADEATIRPKTLDGIVLQLDTEVRFEFLKNLSSPAALASGDEETGTFIYTSLFDYVVGDDTRNEHRNFENLAGTTTFMAFPQAVTLATYRYRAINASSAVLTLIATGVDNTHFGHQIPFMEGADGFITHVVEIDLTFSSNGAVVSTNIIKFRLPESTLVNTLDTMFIPSLVRLTTGGNVPENYNPTPDPNRPSKIAPASLSTVTMSATNGIPDSSKDFTIQFVKDGSYSGGGGTGSTTPDEIGQGLLRVSGTAVDVALDYTWRRIGGSDNGELVLSNIPNNALQPFLNSLNGSYTLVFQGFDTGLYTGSVDGGTPNVADVSGTFIILDGSTN